MIESAEVSEKGGAHAEIGGQAIRQEVVDSESAIPTRLGGATHEVNPARDDIRVLEAVRQSPDPPASDLIVRVAEEQPVAARHLGGPVPGPRRSRSVAAVDDP